MCTGRGAPEGVGLCAGLCAGRVGLCVPAKSGVGLQSLFNLMSDHNAEVVLLRTPNDHFSERSFSACQNFQNWPIILVNNHFSVSEFYQMKKSF